MRSPAALRRGNEKPADKRQVVVNPMVALDPLQRAWELLEAIPDPEIPVVSIRELGILREINQQGDELEVVITPTYSGCPAMGQIEDDVRAALQAAGLSAKVVTRLAPPWSTDWISEAAKEKLRSFGIAPPHATPAAHAANTVQFARRSPAQAAPVHCPHCGSASTTETSHFSSTACKALYKCLDCLEPFDYFKPY
jgi:ring-1,2-phenylacetyl-CoA epoxidase subunit PaaD